MEYLAELLKKKLSEQSDEEIERKWDELDSEFSIIETKNEGELPMTNEEKAQEIARSCFSKRTVDLPVNKLEQVIIKDACLNAMAWKEEQMTKNAIDFLVGTLSCTDGFIEEFISVMKGE